MKQQSKGFDFFMRLMFCSLTLILLIQHHAQACKKEEVSSQIQWKTYQFRVLKISDRYYVESCKEQKCSKQNFDDTVEQDSPDWPVMLNSLLIVDQTVWLGSSVGIYSYNENKQKWEIYEGAKGIYDVTSLSQIDDRVFATREGGADVCGVRMWTKKDRWLNVPETGCYGYIASTVVNNTLFVAGYDLLAAFDYPQLKRRAIPLPQGLKGIHALSAVGDKLLVHVRPENKKAATYTYSDVNGGQWSQPLIEQAAKCEE